MTIEHFFENDRFAQLVGVKLVKANQGHAEAELQIGDQHLNSLGLVHGGAIFSLADAAFAAAVNSHGIDAVAINLTISFLKPARNGKLLASAREISLTRVMGTYLIDVTDESGNRVASLHGTAYRMADKKKNQ